MKKLFLFLLLLLFSTLVFGQTSYIQVTGEPELFVYLNNQFKGKTSAEFNGLIIEKVTAGDNLIKIVKTGYTPFEEHITVKAGEVFAYKVKPFTKHVVQISEQGNSAVSEDKATIETGKLIIQSVPIEIKITIPDIEGVKDSPKTKDEWMAEKIPVGNYEITFTYNQKVVTKTIEIDRDNTTSVFVNMLTGECTVKKVLYENVQRENVIAIVNSTIDSLCSVYKFRRGLLESEFRAYNSEVAQLIPMGGGYEGNSENGRPSRKDKTPGPESYFGYTYRAVTRYRYILQGEPYADAKMLEFYNTLLAYYKRRIPSEFPNKYLNISDQYNFFFIRSTSTSGLDVWFHYEKSGSNKYSYVVIEFKDNKNYSK